MKGEEGKTSLHSLQQEMPVEECWRGRNVSGRSLQLRESAA